MKQHTHRSLLACAATLALTLPLAPTAQAQVMAQSKVSVSGLKITLIDLNTADGVTPGFSAVGSFGGIVDNQRTPELVPYSLVPIPTDYSYGEASSSATPLLSLASQLNGGKVTVPTTPTGTTLTLGTTLSASTSANLNRATTTVEDLSYVTPDWRYDAGTDQYVYGTESFTGQRTTKLVSADAAIGLLGTEEEEAFYGPALTVTANTLVVIEGTATLSSTVDARRVLALQASDPNLKTELLGGASTQLFISMAKNSFAFPEDPTLSGSAYSDSGSAFNQVLGLGYDMNGFYTNTGFNGEEALAIEDLNLPLSGLLTVQQTGQFRVSMANASLDSVLMYLNMNISSVSQHASSSLSAPGATFVPAPLEVPEVPTVPNIPEPGTWAQMGLGLIALVAAVRRRRARA
jgi:PEP-CTERM motif